MPLDFSDIICAPSRKPLKFSCGSFTRHSLCFDSAISREDRHVIFLEIFVCSDALLPESSGFAAYPRPRYSPDEYVELRVATDHRHPVYGQMGLYAKKTIPSNTVVTSYSGFLEVFGSSCNSRTYTMGFGTVGDDFALDAEFAGNYGRFANDPRGVFGLSANLIAENRFNARGEAFTALVSRRQIMEGEEILMSYGKAHSLGSSPWTNVEGQPVVRSRCSGMIPFPGVENSMKALCRRNSSEARQKLFSYDLAWECPQCGAWSLWRSKGSALSRCETCHTPKSTGCPLVALMESPLLAKKQELSNESPLNPSFLAPPLTRERNTRRKNNDTPRMDKIPSTSELVRASSCYLSTKVKWPLSMPFLPWQVWDPTVPIATVLKHSRFESQEHLFLYRVTPSLAATEENIEDVRGDDFVVEVKEEDNPLKIKRGRKRERHPSEKMWERCELGSTNRGNILSESRAPLSEHPLVQISKEETGKISDSVGFSVSLCLPSSSSLILSSYLWTTSSFDPSSQINRFLLVKQIPYGCPEPHLESAKESLLQIRCRLYTGRSFSCGELVGYVGGVIRNIGDPRCRPDNSPLEIPMKYFLPWRSDPQFCNAASGCGTTEPKVISNEHNLFKVKQDLLSRLSRLSLVVTNEMMYCPCLAVDDDNFYHMSSSFSTDVGDPEKSPKKIMKEVFPRREQLRGGNVTFILTIDSLGCPFVACVATTRLSAFEPLLAVFS